MKIIITKLNNYINNNHDSSPASPRMRPSFSWPEAVVNTHPLDVDIVVISVPSLSWQDALGQLYPSTSAQQRLSLPWPEAAVNVHPLDVDIVVISVSVPYLA
ncbi:hypothetical protein N9L19_01435 [bacterium]|nr:hypothetical protein [bacterium]